MSFNNIIAIVGDKYNTINLIASKLVLLRDLDKVVDTNLENAVTFLSSAMPNVIIIHAIGDSEECLNTIKQIKHTEILNNIPILLYSDNCTKEFLIDAFDCGISDIIKSPIEDWELLIRVIWCIQKNEINVNIDSRNNFYTSLGIIQDKTGFYTHEYVEHFLVSKINSAIRYKTKGCLMLVGADNKFPPARNLDLLNEVIKHSIRLSDSVGIREDGKYYIYLPKTKLNGAYAVFERINNNLGLDLSVNASISEINDKDFGLLKPMLEKTYEETLNCTNTILVAHDVLTNSFEETKQNEEKKESVDFIEKRKSLKEKFSNSFKGKVTAPLEYNMQSFEESAIKEEPEQTDIFPEIKNVEEEHKEIDFENAQNIMQSVVQSVTQEAPADDGEFKIPELPPVNFDDHTEEDERNAVLFRQAYGKKCELVTKPVFDKFKLQVQTKHPDMEIIKNVSFNQSYFVLRLNDKILRLTVNYPGFSKVDIITEIYLGEERRGYNAFDLNITEFSFQKLSITLEGLIKEYESYL